MKNPKWLKNLVRKVCRCCLCSIKGRMSGFSFKYSTPDDNAWGTWLIEIAPEALELVENGPHDGQGIFDPVDVDLLELPSVLTEVESLAYHPGSPHDEPHILLTGSYKKHEVVVRIFFRPFEDAEPDRVFDAVNKCWRDKKSSDDLE